MFDSRSGVQSAVTEESAFSIPNDIEMSDSRTVSLARLEGQNFRELSLFLMVGKTLLFMERLPPIPGAKWIKMKQ